MRTTDDRNGSSPSAPLSPAALTMDVADTLRRAPELAAAADPKTGLRDLYAAVGIDVADETLSDGLAAWRENRFTYTPPTKGLGPALARLYVFQRRWLPGVLALVLICILALGGYYLVYRPYRIQQREQARIELTQAIPARIDALYQTIAEETKVQQAAKMAADIRDRGKSAAAKGERDGAEQAVTDLTALRDTLRADYRLTVVTRPSQKWGFWTFPADNSDETNYYLIVEAYDAAGHLLTLPVKDEQTGRTESVMSWGLRVPEDVYRSVEADKNDDGVIDHALVGVKQFGFLEPDYLVDVLGGAVTRW